MEYADMLDEAMRIFFNIFRQNSCVQISSENNEECLKNKLIATQRAILARFPSISARAHKNIMNYIVASQMLSFTGYSFEAVEQGLMGGTRKSRKSRRSKKTRTFKRKSRR